MNISRLSVVVLMVTSALMSGCHHTPGGCPLRCTCFDHLPRDRKWILHNFYEPHRYNPQATCWSPMMYNPCSCCWGPNVPGGAHVDGPIGGGEIIDAPAPDPATPLPDSALPLPPFDTDPAPSLEGPLPGEEGLVPDLRESSQNTFQPLIRPISFDSASDREGAPILRRVPRID